MKPACPCGSGNPYLDCCGKYHLGTLVPDALSLMRSRYSAFVLKKIDYLIATVHPNHPDCKISIPKRRKELVNFCESTRFKELKILDYSPNENQATVTFHASLLHEGKDASFTETSYFEKVNGKWLYRSGTLHSKSE